MPIDPFTHSSQAVNPTKSLKRLSLHVTNDLLVAKSHTHQSLHSWTPYFIIGHSRGKLHLLISMTLHLLFFYVLLLKSQHSIWFHPLCPDFHSLSTWSVNDVTYTDDFNYYFQIDESQIPIFFISLLSCLTDSYTSEFSASQLQYVSLNLILFLYSKQPSSSPLNPITPKSETRVCNYSVSFMPT